MELLRLDNEQDFWPSLLNHHQQPKTASDEAVVKEEAPRTPCFLPATNNNNLNHHVMLDKEAKDSDKKCPRSRHNYYDCCVNVHVSALLDHWLDWDCPARLSGRDVTRQRLNGAANASASDSTDVDQLIAHLAALADPIPRVRQYCTDLGCDVLNVPDKEGRTLLHHLLAGKVNRALPEMTQVLLESGADPNARDSNGDTPFLMIRALINAKLYEEAVQVAQTIIASEAGSKVEVNALNNQERCLLSYSVQMGDVCLPLTRLLLNAGAHVWPGQKHQPSQCADALSTVDFLALEKERSCFAWLLKAIMLQSGPQPSVQLQGYEDTLGLVCQAMAEQPVRMKQHVHRTFMQLGNNRSVNGPLFRMLHGYMIPFWAQPQRLRYLCVNTVRRALGPKRLASSPSLSTLALPSKLRRLLELTDLDSSFSEQRQLPSS